MVLAVVGAMLSFTGPRQNTLPTLGQPDSPGATGKSAAATPDVPREAAVTPEGPGAAGKSAAAFPRIEWDVLTAADESAYQTWLGRLQTTGYRPVFVNTHAVKDHFALPALQSRMVKSFPGRHPSITAQTPTRNAST